MQLTETTVIGRNVAPLEHIILIPNQHVFALSQKWCVLKGEASKTTRGEHANDCVLLYVINENVDVNVSVNGAFTEQLSSRTLKI